MTILRHPQQVNRDTLQPSDRFVIPTEVEGPAVSLPRSPFIPPWVGEAGGQLYGEPHSWSLPAFASGKSAYAPVLMNKAGRVPTG